MSTTRRGRPRGSSAEELLEVARDVLLEHGFAGTTMDVIAARARVSKASLYRQFGSKDELFAATVADWVARGRDSMRPHVSELAAAADLPVALGRFARTLQAAVLSPSVLRMRALVTAEADRFPAVAAGYVTDSWERNVAALAGAFEAHGLPDPEIAAEQFTWLCAGAPLNRRILGVPVGAEELERVADAAVATFLARFGPDGGPSTQLASEESR